MRAFLHLCVHGRDADALVNPAAQPRSGALGGEFACVHDNHQTGTFALRGGFGGGQCGVDVGFQFVGFGLFAEDLRVSVDALFRAGNQVFGVRRHFNRGGDFVELVDGFVGTAAGDDELRFEGVERFVVRLEQRADVLRLFHGGFQVAQIGCVHRRAHVHAQCGERVQRAEVVHGHALGIFRHGKLAARGLYFDHFALDVGVRFQRRLVGLRFFGGRGGGGCRLLCLFAVRVARGERGQNQQDGEFGFCHEIFFLD